MKTHDVIVIGAGHNGLTAAAYLARAGLDVLVLERNPYIGGAAVSRELYPGFTYSNCSYVSSLMRPEIMRDLDLPRYGLQITPFRGGLTMTRDGDYIASYRDRDMHRREIARHSPRDAESYDRYSAAVMRQCRFIRPMLLETPPDPTSLLPRDLRGLWRIGRAFRDLGPAGMYETIRFWTMSMADFLDQYFENDLVKAHFTGSSIIGTGLGPRSPGSAYVMLHHHMGEVDGTIGAWGYARGGMGAISRSLAGALEAAGGAIRTDAPVARVIVRKRRVAGVALEDGEEISARAVVSGMDFRRTVLQAMEPGDLPAGLVKAARNFKIRGSSGKLNIALDGMPTFRGVPADCPALAGDLHVTETIEEFERAYDDWKNGRWSRRPYVDLMIPSLTDPTMTPPGKHYMSIFVQYVPPELADGPWTSEKRDAFGRTVIDMLSEYSPDLKDLILHMEVRTPRELEEEVGLTEGNIFQGELTLDQLMFNRPAPGYAQYRLPVRGMYMCGSSTHPGGGVMGAPGANAAREIIADLRAGKRA
ncbi:MAG: NAD(P)/FAD-dependent oxidoreductase [Rhodospirillales bacterium]|nr:MAG: NAD(P)/FAD-dependent oxidoreductase [Rhodospirillales bacterium]